MLETALAPAVGRGQLTSVELDAHCRIGVTEVFAELPPYGNRTGIKPGFHPGTGINPGSPFPPPQDAYFETLLDCSSSTANPSGALIGPLEHSRAGFQKIPEAPGGIL